MTRRRLLVFGSLVGLLALSVGGWVLWQRTAITRENAAKIQVGMTLAEVEAILGGPARDARTASTAPSYLDDQPNSGLQQHEMMTDAQATPPPMEWYSDRVVIFVRFDPNGHVSSCHYLFFCREDNVIAALRRWLRL